MKYQVLTGMGEIRYRGGGGQFDDKKFVNLIMPHINSLLIQYKEDIQKLKETKILSRKMRGNECYRIINSNATQPF